jgi:hypothetical protein
MSKPKTNLPSALKHGCYSALNTLPTEDRAAFDKLHRDLVAEYKPTGVSEELVVSLMASCLWRRENIATYGLAEHARRIHSSISGKLSPPWNEMSLLGPKETRSPEQLKVVRKEVEEETQRELGTAAELVDIGAVASTEHLEKELLLIERLNGMIARCLKQLLLVRGVKSMVLSTPAEAAPKLKRIA